MDTIYTVFDEELIDENMNDRTIGFSIMNFSKAHQKKNLCVGSSHISVLFPVEYITMLTALVR